MACIRWHADRFLGDAFRVLSCPFWSTALQCGARLPIHTLNNWSVVSGVRFLTRGVFECDIGHLWSVAVLCMLWKIRCNPMHPLYWMHLCRMCQCGLHTVPWSLIGTLIFASSLQNIAVSHNLSFLSVSLWDDLADSLSDRVRLACFMSRANAYFFGLSCYFHFCHLLYLWNTCMLLWIIVGLR